jgi:hypothetical protein
MRAIAEPRREPLRRFRNGIRRGNPAEIEAEFPRLCRQPLFQKSRSA